MDCVKGPMKEASPFEVDGLVKGCLRGQAWHCTFCTAAGRQRRVLSTKNKRQAERRARERAELIQREDWGLATLDWRSKPAANTFASFVRDDEEFEPLLAELPGYAGASSWRRWRPVCGRGRSADSDGQRGSAGRRAAGDQGQEQGIPDRAPGSGAAGYAGGEE